MKTYKEEYTAEFGSSEVYHFDVGAKYIYHTGDHSRGKIHKDHFKNSLEVNRKSFSKYSFEEIDVGEVPIKMKRRMLEYILDARDPRGI